jgi:hypothetical protein
MAKRFSCFAALCVSAMLMFAPPASAQGLNCDDFDSQAAAQQRLREDPSDPDGLDGPPGEGFIGIEGVACEDLLPPKNLAPVTPPGDNAVDPPGVRASPKGGPPKGKPPEGGLPENNKELLEAGGNLPLPQRSDAGEVSGDSERFPLWRVVGMILSAGVFVFSLYRLLHPLQRHSWPNRFFFGP